MKKNISYSNVQKNNVFLSIKDGLLDSSKYRSNIEGSSENLESIYERTKKPKVKQDANLPNYQISQIIKLSMLLLLNLITAQESLFFLCGSQLNLSRVKRIQITNNLISEQLLANSTAQCHARNRSLILMLPAGAFTRAAVCIGECVASKVARSSTCVCVGGMEF